MDCVTRNIQEAGVIPLSSRDLSTILLIGSDTMLGYLLKRYAERSGYQLATNQKILPAEEVKAINPAVIIFLSIELLESAQPLVEELANLDTPILVCSSIAEEARARELGADFCLMHPLTYDSFYTSLITTSTPKRT
jgi:DNA-binding response OmpR family regulator